MDENLAGYLLNSLDPETQRAVEGYLRVNPQARQKLALVREALEPLTADREELLPPADLRIRTLARVAEYRCRDVARVPPAPPIRPLVGPSWWRRADMLVAASLLIICLFSLFPWLAHAQRIRYRQECMNNLSEIFQALVVYSDHHQGRLPSLEETPPHNFAGVFVPILYQEGALNNVNLACPGAMSRGPTPISLEQLDEAYQKDPQRYEQYVREVGGCYAYPLGYRNGGQLCGLSVEASLPRDQLPIIADRPPFDSSDYADLLGTNSSNHGGEGQNVLFLSGRVEFVTSRNVGWNGNDIYLNQNHRLAPGLNNRDIVLAASGVRPIPPAPLDP
jgi:hypothetical protein